MKSTKRDGATTTTTNSRKDKDKSKTVNAKPVSPNPIDPTTGNIDGESGTATPGSRSGSATSGNVGKSAKPKK